MRTAEEYSMPRCDRFPFTLGTPSSESSPFRPSPTLLLGRVVRFILAHEEGIASGRSKLGLYLDLALRRLLCSIFHANKGKPPVIGIISIESYKGGIAEDVPPASVQIPGNEIPLRGTRPLKGRISFEMNGEYVNLFAIVVYVLTYSEIFYDSIFVTFRDKGAGNRASGVLYQSGQEVLNKEAEASLLKGIIECVFDDL